MTPPPTTTTRAWAGMLTGVEWAAVTGNGCPAQKRDLGIFLRVSHGDKLPSVSHGTISRRVILLAAIVKKWRRSIGLPGNVPETRPMTTSWPFTSVTSLTATLK
jgi:hypothetical protein